MGITGRARTVALITVLVVVAAGCDWLQWAGGPGHPGSNFEPSITPTTVAGMVSTPMDDLQAATPPAVANGLVFVADADTLRAYDSRNYAVVWTATLPEGTTAGTAPAVDPASKTVFLVVSTPTKPVLLGFDVDGLRNCNIWFFDCSPIFRADLGSAPGAATPPVLAGGKVFATGAGAVQAFTANGTTNCTPEAATAVCTPLWSAATGFDAAGVGPAVRGSQVFAAVDTGSGLGIGAFAEPTGAAQWSGVTGAVTATPSVTGDNRVFVPAGARIEVFAGGGCGGPSCAPAYGLVPRPEDAGALFDAAIAFDGGRIHATSNDGTLSTWPLAACGDPDCVPTYGVTVHTPEGGSTAFTQSPVVANGIAFVLAQRAVESVDHTVLVALNATDGAELDSWDLGEGGFGAGLANPAVAWGLLYVPTDDELFAIHPTEIEPLTSMTTSPLELSPAFAPGTFDYALNCAAGTNAVDFTATAVPGGSVRLVQPVSTAAAPSLSTTVSLLENQAAVLETRDAQNRLRQYWVRCLPNDFPGPTSTVTFPSAGKPSPGWYLAGNNLKAATDGFYVMVLDRNGTPVWYRKVTAQPTNVMWLGPNRLAWFNDGQFDIYSLATNTLQSTAMVGRGTDQHELTPLPNGNFLMMSYDHRQGVDLTGLPGASPAPGANETIVDCILQEVDPQGQLVWEWIGSDHMDPVTETTTPSSQVTGSGTRIWDVFHCNSIDSRPDNGNVLLSARNTDGVYEIDRATGQIAWKLGGTPTTGDGAAIITIQNDPQTRFVLQHDARYLPNGNISIFDNQRASGAPDARGIEYAVDFDAGTAEPVFSFAQPEGNPSCCMGSYRQAPDGHHLIGWGWVLGILRTMTELDEDGEPVLDIALGPGNVSYRAVKVPPSRLDLTTMRRTAGT